MKAQLQRCNTGMQNSPSPSPAEVLDKNQSNAEHLAHLKPEPVVGGEAKSAVVAPATQEALPKTPADTRKVLSPEEAEKARLKAVEEAEKLEAARLEEEIDADMEKLGKELEELNAKEGLTEKEKAAAANKTKQKLEAHARYMRYYRCVNSRLGLSNEACVFHAPYSEALARRLKSDRWPGRPKEVWAPNDSQMFIAFVFSVAVRPSCAEANPSIPSCTMPGPNVRGTGPNPSSCKTSAISRRKARWERGFGCSHTRWMRSSLWRLQPSCERISKMTRS